MDEYYIEAGVHRAVAAREAGLTEIRAVLYVPYQPPQHLSVPLDRLHSSRRSVVGHTTRRRDLPGLIRAMADPVARAKVPEIAIQRLGEQGQPSTIPLADVGITDQEEP